MQVVTFRVVNFQGFKLISLKSHSITFLGILHETGTLYRFPKQKHQMELYRQTTLWTKKHIFRIGDLSPEITPIFTREKLLLLYNCLGLFTSCPIQIMQISSACSSWLRLSESSSVTASQTEFLGISLETKALEFKPAKLVNRKYGLKK